MRFGVRDGRSVLYLQRAWVVGWGYDGGRGVVLGGGRKGLCSLEEGGKCGVGGRGRGKR